MAAKIEKKRVTLHPLKEDGSLDLQTNLYPKTFVSGIVNDDGEVVDIALQEEVDSALNTMARQVENIAFNLDTNISRVNDDLQHSKQETATNFETISARISEDEETISGIEDRLSAHDSKFEIDEAAITSLKVNKQATLISGVNIKTINNESILGEGNLLDVPTQKDFDDAVTEITDRLDNLEETVGDFESDINSITNDINLLKTTKQTKLVSGINIKTINNQDILGSGNINIQGGGSNKHIYLTTYAQHHYDSFPYYDRPIWEDDEIIGFEDCEQDLMELYCRVNLVNFTEEDIGSKIYLFRKKRNNTKFKYVGDTSDIKTKNYNRYYKHPKHWSAVTGKDNIQGFGYGLIADTKDSTGYWPALNTYQQMNRTNGFIETEWELTAADIANGYKDINISKMMVNLFVPNNTNDSGWITDLTVDDHTKLFRPKTAFSNTTFIFNIFNSNNEQITFDSQKLKLQLIYSEHSHRFKHDGVDYQWPLEAYYAWHSSYSSETSYYYVPANKHIFAWYIE